MPAPEEAAPPEKLDFIREIVAQDITAGENGGKVITRFPPEPNGYLHIGHAKAICLDFGIAHEFGDGTCHLRFDDTNPTKEETEYVDSIKEDVAWLGFDWGENLFFASDYFPRLFEAAEQLIADGLAYIDSQTPEEIRENRGDLVTPGKNSPFRGRSPEENSALFHEMRDGKHPDGSHVLRAKIDMTSPNMIMRDPVIYRILHAEHHRTGNAWCLYPMYDFAHPLSDAIEGVTHSICTLEFEIHRPLYDWCVENVKGLKSRPKQREFAKLNLSYTMMSKRNLLKLVESGKVTGWDDPRMPTLSGIRRRGFPAAAIRKFCKELGVTKFNSLTDVGVLENAVRQELNATAPRRMAVLNPLKLTITNLEEEETLTVVNNPGDESAGTRDIVFSREILIEQDDFKEDANRKFFRLKPGGEVRLRGSYIVKCETVEKDADGNITALTGTIDKDTLGKNPEDRKVKGVIHWVSAPHAVTAEVHLIDRLFATEDMTKAEGDFIDHLNPDSLTVIPKAHLEPSLATAEPGTPVQFERLGYFIPDKTENTWLRTIGLRDTWAKVAKK